MRKFDIILFDLDGTLLNPSKRLYCLFKELTGCTLSYEEYWREKGKGKKQQEMLKLVGYSASAESFRRKWLENVERKDLLAMDDLFPEVRETLVRMKDQGMNLYIVTNRQSYGGTKLELESLGIGTLFERIIVTEQRCSKAEAVIRAGVSLERSFFIGDSSEDMETAKVLNIPGVLVTRGCKAARIEAGCRIRDLRELWRIIDEE